jgi:hypothetical protein
MPGGMITSGGGVLFYFVLSVVAAISRRLKIDHVKHSGIILKVVFGASYGVMVGVLVYLSRDLFHG